MGWFCFNRDSDSDSDSEDEIFNLRYFFQTLYPDDALDPPQEPPSLCPSLSDFIKKFLCCGWCRGVSDDEWQHPSDNPVPQPLCLPITIWTLLLNSIRNRNVESERFS